MLNSWVKKARIVLACHLNLGRNLEGMWSNLHSLAVKHFVSQKAGEICLWWCGLQFSKDASKNHIIKIASEQKAVTPKATWITWNRQRWGHLPKGQLHPQMCSYLSPHPQRAREWLILGKVRERMPCVCSRTSTWPGLAARSGPTPCSLPNIVPCTWPVPGFCSLRHLTTFSERTSPTLPQPHPIPSLGQTCNYGTWKAASEIPHRGRAAPSKQPSCKIFFLQHPFPVAVLCHPLTTPHQWPCQPSLPLIPWAQSRS